MTYDMADDLYPNRIPADFTGRVASYLDHPSNPDAWAQLCARFPNNPKTAIVINPYDNEGDALDVEPGITTPVQSEPALAVQWVQARRAAGHPDPTVYCGQNVWWAPIQAAFDAAGVAHPSYWVANYSLDPVVIPAGAKALQHQDVPPDYSICSDDWPATAPTGDDMPGTIIRDATAGDIGAEYATDGLLGCSPVPIDGPTAAAYVALGWRVVDLTGQQVGLIRQQVSAQQQNLIHWIVAAIQALPAASSSGTLTPDQITAAVQAGLASVTAVTTATTTITAKPAAVS